MTQPRILVLAGSLRKEALSKKLARVAARHLAAHGADVDLIELQDFAMPPYDGDIEDGPGLPDGANALHARIQQAQGLLFCSPEYNHSIPGTFKNALDWVSRHEQDAFAGKTVALFGSSPGGVGGMRSLAHLRDVMTALGVWLLPDQVTVAKANTLFDEQGALTSEFLTKQVDQVCAKLLRETACRKAAQHEEVHA